MRPMRKEWGCGGCRGIVFADVENNGRQRQPREDEGKSSLSDEARARGIGGRKKKGRKREALAILVMIIQTT